MAITIDIDTARPYQVHVGTFLLEQAGPLVRATAGGTKAVIVTDTNVGPLYQMPVKQSLDSFICANFVVEAPIGWNTIVMVPASLS